MPSKKNKSTYSSRQLFAALVVISLVLWILYRSLFNFPVIFDETVGKALFFGLPIWIYLSSTGQEKVVESLSLGKMKQGLLRGLAMGGLFGFVGILISIVMKGPALDVVRANLFGANQFWWEFLLALPTAFWESLFFFAFIQTALKDQFKKMDTTKIILISSLVFLLFHIPNSILRFQGTGIWVQLWLMSLFALGQSILFHGSKNTYTIIFTHAIWGMVLLIHF
ncbi:MAG: CPBP family glutamic-type intramembrane protease [Patescibacteria group bacterium]|nr:CPBP family glutamic-type intramembrane protease [Patescibacteria group bacterium]